MVVDDAEGGRLLSGWLDEEERGSVGPDMDDDEDDEVGGWRSSVEDEGGGGGSCDICACKKEGG
jgi:hypothetical protein